MNFFRRSSRKLEVKLLKFLENVSDENGYLGFTGAEGRKRRYQTGFDTLVVYTVKYEC